MKNQKNSIGQVIRNIQSNKIDPIYALSGNELFLQDFFIDMLKKYFLDDLSQSIIYSIGDDKEDAFLSELSSISLFDDKKVIVVRQIQKLSKKGREELVEYLVSPNIGLCIILILDKYDEKSSIQKYLKSNFLLIDVRVPFSNKIKEWVSYIIKQRKYKVTSGTIDDLISIYGDSISHMVNEIDKLALMNESGNVVNSQKLELSDSEREFPVWQLLDSLGEKDLKKSLIVSHSLLQSGVSLIQIVINITNLFMQLLWNEMGRSNIKGYTYTGLNKIITSNLSKYSKLFSKDEIDNILVNLAKTDMIIKTTSIDEIILNDIMIFMICGENND
tara:strand:+ start:265 stop:1257 length:993 start_codon:yes stop_codon:yes gene_type:complete